MNQAHFLVNSGADKKEGQVIAVYDLGGGTFDVSVLEISGAYPYHVLCCGCPVPVMLPLMNKIFKLNNLIALMRPFLHS